ncbi:MAG: hypothetical protein SOW31_11170 [Treponema sp.]|nr:hypothetical protein [Treponema sp.]
MKKLLFIPFFFLSLLVGCKGGPGDIPEVREEFDLGKIRFEYTVASTEYKGLELYKKVSNGNDHYLFYIRNGIIIGSNDHFKVFYGDELLDSIKYFKGFRHEDITDEFEYEILDGVTLTSMGEENVDMYIHDYDNVYAKKYFNLELNIEEPETFGRYSYDYDILDNKVHIVILPVVKYFSLYDFMVYHENGQYMDINYNQYIVESDNYPFYYSNDEKDIHIGFTFKEDLFKPNCIDDVYNFTDLTKNCNNLYCNPSCTLPNIGDNTIYDYMNIDGRNTGKELVLLVKKLIGLDYKSFDDFSNDYNIIDKCISTNGDLSWYKDNNKFKNSLFTEEHYNYLKDLRTFSYVSYDKLKVNRYDFSEGYYLSQYNFQVPDEYEHIGFKVNIDRVGLYDSKKSNFTPVITLSETEFPIMYNSLKENDIYIPLSHLEISPYENKILGWNFTKYRY